MPKKILTGIVLRDKADKTVTVVVERKYQHTVLKKDIKSKKKYSVHYEKTVSYTNLTLPTICSV